MKPRECHPDCVFHSVQLQGNSTTELLSKVPSQALQLHLEFLYPALQPAWDTLRFYLYKGIFYLYLTFNKPHLFLRGSEKNRLGFFCFPTGKCSRGGTAQLPNSHKNKAEPIRRLPKCRQALSHNPEMFGCSGIGETLPKYLFCPAVLSCWQSEGKELQGSSGQTKPK